MQTSQTPQIKAVPMTLFPEMGNLDEVMELAKSKVTCIERNELHSLFMTYHNTLIRQLTNN